jgi:hypothetical protein
MRRTEAIFEQLKHAGSDVFVPLDGDTAHRGQLRDWIGER